MAHLSYAAERQCLTNYMTIVINTQAIYDDRHVSDEGNM